MKSKSILFIICCLYLNVNVFSQKIKNILFGDTVMTINEFVLFKKNKKLFNNLDSLKRELKLVRIKKCDVDKENLSIYFDFSSGVEFATNLSTSFVDNIVIYYDESGILNSKVARRIRYYRGRLEVMGFEISNATTYSDVKDFINSKPLVKDCVSKTSTKNVIEINSKVGQYILLFNWDEDKATTISSIQVVSWY